MLRFAPLSVLSVLLLSGSAEAGEQELEPAENAPAAAEVAAENAEGVAPVVEAPPPEEQPPEEEPSSEVGEPGPEVPAAETPEESPPHAEPPTPPPIPPPPPAPTPFAAPSVQQGAWGWATPAPSSAPVDRGADHGAATREAREARRKQLPWRDSAVIWGHLLTTSAAGIGGDYQSTAHQVYLQNVALLLNYHLVTRDRFGLRLALVPELELELTDSAATTTRREPWFADLPLVVAGRWVIAENEPALTSTTLLGNWTTIFPTSKASRAEGDILTLSPRIGLVQSLPLLGKGSSWLSQFSFGAELRYDHLFSEATTPVHDELNAPAQDRFGRPSSTDLLNGAQLAPNRGRVRGFLSFAEEVLGNPTQLTLSAFYETAQLHGVEPVTLELATGPVEVSPNPHARTSQPSAGIAVELGYAPIPELGVAFGYANRADLDSETPNPFYTPGALFLLNLTLYLDQLYLSVTPATEERVALTGQRFDGAERY